MHTLFSIKRMCIHVLLQHECSCSEMECVLQTKLGYSYKVEGQLKVLSIRTIPHREKWRWSKREPRASLAVQNEEENKLRLSHRNYGTSPYKPAAGRLLLDRTPKCWSGWWQFAADQGSSTGKGRRCRCTSPEWGKWGAAQTLRWTAWPKRQWSDTGYCPSRTGRACCTRLETLGHTNQSWRGRRPWVHLRLKEESCVLKLASEYLTKQSSILFQAAFFVIISTSEVGKGQRHIWQLSFRCRCCRCSSSSLRDA